MVYSLNFGEIVTTIPTIGFNVEEVTYKNVLFTVWDVGGKDKIRPLWRYFYQTTVGLIFVVDSLDRERIDDSSGSDNSAKDELHRMLAEDELRDTPLLVFANKQDLAKSMSVNEVTERLGLNQLRNRKWYIQGTCAITGDGLYDGLDWLTNTLQKDTALIARAKKNLSTLGTFKNRGYNQSKEDQERGQQWMEKQRQHLYSQQKSILVVSGYIREFWELEVNKKLMTFIPVSVTKLVHLFYHNTLYHFDKTYKYYGEYGVDKDTRQYHMDLKNFDIKDQVALNEFLNRSDNDENYIHDDEKFIKSYIETNGKVNEEEQKYDDKEESKMNSNDDEKDKWNHYDFMRFIWISFTKYYKARKDGNEDEKNKNRTIRQLGMKEIWDYSPFNTTKTYFWSQLIFYGIEVDKSVDKISSNNFNYFLFENPSLSNNYKNLINNYYSNKLIQEMDSEAKKNEMILPDIMPLPSLITNVKKIKDEQQKKNGDNIIDKIEIKKIEDSLFIKEFENLTFKSWDKHLSFLRVIWCYLENGISEQNIMNTWKLFAKDNYNQTLTNFWIKMVIYCKNKYIEYFDQNKDKNKNKPKDTDIISIFSFDGFLSFCEWKEYNISNDQLYLEYYTSDLIRSEKAINEIVDPDKQSLPSFNLYAK